MAIWLPFAMRDCSTAAQHMDVEQVYIRFMSGHLANSIIKVCKQDCSMLVRCLFLIIHSFIKAFACVSSKVPSLKCAVPLTPRSQPTSSVAIDTRRESHHQCLAHAQAALMGPPLPAILKEDSETKTPLRATISQSQHQLKKNSKGRPRNKTSRQTNMLSLPQSLLRIVEEGEVVMGCTV